MVASRREAKELVQTGLLRACLVAPSGGADGRGAKPACQPNHAGKTSRGGASDGEDASELTTTTSTADGADSGAAMVRS